MTLTVNENVVWTDTHDEVRLYATESGEFQTLNSSAAHIWRLMARGRSTGEIVAELTATFADGDDQEAELIGRDVIEFIETLRAAGLVRETDGARDAG